VKREDWDRKYSEQEQLWSSHPYRFFESEVADLAPGRALDLACGEGRHTILLATLGWKAIGVDFSEVAIARARERAVAAGVDVDFQHEDLLDFEPGPASYDLVVVFFLHLPPEDRRRVLGRAASALAPGGTFLLVGHDVLNASAGVGGPSDVSLLYTAQEITEELAEILPGLEIEKAERVLRTVENEESPAIDALVKAHRPQAASSPNGPEASNRLNSTN